MEETTKDKVPSIEDHPILKDYEDVFREIWWFRPKRDIDFPINWMLGDAPMSMNLYRMRILELKELQLKLE
jgi:hypothetical protein